MRISVISFLAILVAQATYAAGPSPRCPIAPEVDSVISELQVDIIFRQTHLSDDWMNKLKKASTNDTLECLAVENALHDLEMENIRLESEVEKLKAMNEDLRYRTQNQ